MDILELGAIGELVGGVAVIATLLYLAVQVRQTNRVASASAFNSISSLQLSLHSTLLADRELGELMVRGRAGLGALDEVDRFRFGLSASMIFRAIDDLYEHQWSGLIAQSQRVDRVAVLRGNFANRGMREYWADNANTYTPRFQSLVDQVLKELDTNPAAEPGAPRS